MTNATQGQLLTNLSELAGLFRIHPCILPKTFSTTTAIHESEVFPAKMRVQKRILNNHGTA